MFRTKIMIWSGGIIFKSQIKKILFLISPLQAFSLLWYYHTPRFSFRESIASSYCKLSSYEGVALDTFARSWIPVISYEILSLSDCIPVYISLITKCHYKSTKKAQSIDFECLLARIYYLAAILILSVWWPEFIARWTFAKPKIEEDFNS